MAKAKPPQRYSVQFKPAAERELKKIRDVGAVKRILAAISALANNPRPLGVKALQGDTSILRIRVGDYRVLYSVIDAEVLVIVISVGHRREVYR